MTGNPMSPLPLVSVVVPSYNNGPFIRETMTSILNQTYRHLEVIVSDHGSTDGTWALLQPFALDPRVRLIQIARSGRVADNWASATNAATGKYLKLVCGDDLLTSDCIEGQVAALERSPGSVMVASRRDVVTACGDPLIRSWGLVGLIGSFDGRVAVKTAVRSGTNPFGEPACVLLCRATLSSVGGWDDRFPYLIDQHTYSKMLMHGSFVGLADSLASFRLSDAQWSVELAGQQYRQVVRFHQHMAAEARGVLTPTDRLMGRLRARVLSFARRFAYKALSRKLRTPAGSPARSPLLPMGSPLVLASTGDGSELVPSARPRHQRPIGSVRRSAHRRLE
jgi:glycosyltransferase involved in cell wall biosynthesis